jgi:peptidoglycan/LPS O-acetylase OafA/YrhL
MPLGVPELFVLVPILLLLVIPFVVAIAVYRTATRRARRFGYASTLTYLRAAPRTDEERRDAADLAMKGLVICLLGFIASPVVLFGLVPLFYGGRKLVYAALGLGLVDDGA